VSLRAVAPSRARALARRAAIAAAAAWCAVGTAGAAPAANPAADDPKVVIQAPHYGDALFHFYQGKYFTSVTTLMASQQFERLAPHGDEGEVLRGGLLLSYGLHREAGEIFAALIEKNAPPRVRDRAWFYLAKIRYQRGLLAGAEDAIGRIGERLPLELEEEKILIKAHLLMARQDFAAAADLLSQAGQRPVFTSRYLRYNLGVALLRNGDAARGRALLDELGRAPAETEEYRSLRDQANLALGFASLQAGEPAAARTSLERVRLHAMHSNKALLGFGWAAAALKDQKLALVPWTELAGREGSDAAVLEARIAVPYAYAELGAFGQALEHYQSALAAYEKESGAIDESIAAIRAGTLLKGLLDRNPGEEMGWFWNIGELPEMPHPGHLAPVLAQHDFQEAFKNWRDLQFLARNLATWQDNLGLYGDMLATRRAAFAERLPQVRAQAQDSGLAALQRQRDALAAELVDALSRQDGAAFADARQRELQALVDGSRATLERMPRDAESDAARERLRLASGALAWQVARQQPDRAWDAQKTLAATDAGLAAAREREAAIAQAQRDEPARFEAFERRIAELGTRIGALAPRVTALATEQQQRVQELAVAELERQKLRLDDYATQARFAVAQIYDRAIAARSSDDATRR
jgi:hypothetical protein